MSVGHRQRRSQKAGVLALLQARGSAGLKSVEMVHGAVDGRPILNYAARVDELRRDGHRITTHREPNGTARYELHPSEVHVTAAAPALPEPEPLPLGDAPRSAVLGWDGE
jgi:hypothetical protein